MAVILLLVGLAFLVVGAEVLVRGASRLASALGISPLVIGLTVVAFGTSSPELAVSIQAGFSGQANIAVGNVVGSNVFNVLFILGISALITPLRVSQQLVRLDVPLMVLVSLLSLGIGLDGLYGRGDGLLLFLGLIGYVGFLIVLSRKEAKEVREEYAQEFGVQPRKGLHRAATDAVLVVVGLGLLVIGSEWLVEAAVSIAEDLGVSDLVIGLTIIAAGTSMPEVVTSVVASLRGERDIAVGNVVGSNLFNLMGVLGLSSLIAPGGIAVSEAALRFDIPIMVAVAFACLPVFFTGHVISRWEGALFLGYYLAYTLYLILAATGSAALGVFSAAMLYFVIPLTVLTLVVLVVRASRARKSS